MYIQIYILNDLRLFCFAYNGILFMFTHFSFYPFCFQKSLSQFNFFYVGTGLFSMYFIMNKLNFFMFFKPCSIIIVETVEMKKILFQQILESSRPNLFVTLYTL